MGDWNFKPLWRSHQTTLRWPVSYRISFMACRSFLIFFTFSVKGGGWVNPSLTYLNKTYYFGLWRDPEGPFFPAEREVTLKSQICRKWAPSHYERCLKTSIIAMGLFQTVLVPIWEIYYWKFERFTKNALTRSIFELEKCSFFLNGSEFRQKLIGTIISVLVRHLRA